MKCTFLGTRGNTEVRSERHHRHSALLVEYYRTAVMVDAGEDWRGRVPAIGPDAIVLTHAHPDHAWGLKDGAPGPVWATAATWDAIDAYPLDARRTVTPRDPFTIEGIRFEAFPVEHSTRCPAVAYRITAGVVTVTYAPDVVYIHDRAAALREATCYIGDGATLTRSMVRTQNDHLIGHTPVRTQLTWCQEEGVPRALFTHCGSEIIKGDTYEMQEKVNQFATERGVEAQIAHDGMEVVLR
ncbi:MAG: MBL fold metallo-hydrolase [Bacteroidetes bacterium]|jgi:phosphoribosyl 1,2-cyclic phosphodiesterase|nr:MBL fold metallo-hydrolase [Bacteroidota bacterium]